MVTNTRKVRKFYKCDFFVRDFSKGRRQQSGAWFIDQFNSHVKGHVSFEENNTQMLVYLMYGRCPRSLGLDSKQGTNVTVKVKVAKEGKKNWHIGSNKHNLDEKVLFTCNDGWDLRQGFPIARLNCNELSTNGWVDKFDKILLKYEISVN